jgi:hypothetical protein
MTLDLATALREICVASADVLVVDLLDDGGGTEWEEAARSGR